MAAVRSFPASSRVLRLRDRFLAMASSQAGSASSLRSNPISAMWVSSKTEPLWISSTVMRSTRTVLFSEMSLRA